MNNPNRTKKSYTFPFTSNRRECDLNLLYKEYNELHKESQWIPEFLQYCEKNNIEKSITYIVPKNINPCPCRRFKRLYSSVFDKIECSRCDLVKQQEKWKIFLSEFKGGKLPKLGDEFYCECKQNPIDE